MLRWFPPVILGLFLLRLAPVDVLCCLPDACIPLAPPVEQVEQVQIEQVQIDSCCAPEVPALPPSPGDRHCDASCCLDAYDPGVEPEWFPRTLSVVLPQTELLAMRAPLAAPSLQVPLLSSGSDPPAPRALRPWMCQLL